MRGLQFRQNSVDSVIVPLEAPKHEPFLDKPDGIDLNSKVCITLVDLEKFADKEQEDKVNFVKT